MMLKTLYIFKIFIDIVLIPLYSTCSGGKKTEVWPLIYTNLCFLLIYNHFKIVFALFSWLYFAYVFDGYIMNYWNVIFR